MPPRLPLFCHPRVSASSSASSAYGSGLLFDLLTPALKFRARHASAHAMQQEVVDGCQDGSGWVQMDDKGYTDDGNAEAGPSTYMYRRSSGGKEQEREGFGFSDNSDGTPGQAAVQQREKSEAKSAVWSAKGKERSWLAIPLNIATEGSTSPRQPRSRNRPLYSLIQPGPSSSRDTYTEPPSYTTQSSLDTIPSCSAAFASQYRRAPSSRAHGELFARYAQRLDNVAAEREVKDAMGRARIAPVHYVDGRLQRTRRRRYEYISKDEPIDALASGALDGRIGLPGTPSDGKAGGRYGFGIDAEAEGYSVGMGSSGAAESEAQTGSTRRPEVRVRTESRALDTAPGSSSQPGFNFQDVRTGWQREEAPHLALPPEPEQPPAQTASGEVPERPPAKVRLSKAQIRKERRAMQAELARSQSGMDNMDDPADWQEEEALHQAVQPNRLIMAKRAGGQAYAGSSWKRERTSPERRLKLVLPDIRAARAWPPRSQLPQPIAPAQVLQHLHHRLLHPSSHSGSIGLTGALDLMRTLPSYRPADLRNVLHLYLTYARYPASAQFLAKWRDYFRPDLPLYPHERSEALGRITQLPSTQTLHLAILAILRSDIRKHDKTPLLHSLLDDFARLSVRPGPQTIRHLVRFCIATNDSTWCRTLLDDWWAAHADRMSKLGPDQIGLQPKDIEMKLGVDTSDPVALDHVRFRFAHTGKALKRWWKVMRRLERKGWVIRRGSGEDVAGRVRVLGEEGGQWRGGYVWKGETRP